MKNVSHSCPNYTQYNNNSGWNNLLPSYKSKDALTDNIESDVLIIGAGFTGIAAAKRWEQISKNDRIVIIDASTAGESNSGRNSGFLLEISLANDADPDDILRMKECNSLISETMRTIQDEIKNSPINSQLNRTGVYRAAVSEIGIKSLNNYSKFLKSSGLDYEHLDRNQLEEKLGTRLYKEGLYNPHCYLAQPAALIRSLVGALSEKIELYENTPAISLQRKRSKWLIKTPKSIIKTNKIIIANNAFCSKLGFAESYISTIYTYAALTKVLNRNIIDSLGSNNNWGILPAHRLGSTLRRTIDGRLMIRSFYDYGKERDNNEISKMLAQKLTRRFPKLNKIDFDSVWGGTTGFTYNGGPIWGEFSKNLFISAGCNGGGIVKGTLFGKLLADLANNKKTPDINKLFGKASWMPPEPIRKIGFKMISMIERNKAKAEI